MRKLPKTLLEHLNRVRHFKHSDKKIPLIYEKGFNDTYIRTLKDKEDGSVFVITGDIMAMWLRDSGAQMRQYIPFAKEDKAIASTIEGVILSQLKQILIDPYANAFNDGPTGRCHQKDDTNMKAEIWERKFEIDSLCYPIQLCYLYYKNTGFTDHLNELFSQVCYEILRVFEIEQHHMSRSDYSFEREEDEVERVKYETLPNKGKGKPVKECGLIWSGFRPSDDACQLGYLIPGNMFAVVILTYMAEIAEQVLCDKVLADKALIMAAGIEKAIETYGIYEHPEYGLVYKYETNGWDDFLLMDDANVPSLLSIPYFGYRDIDHQVYQNTRRMILSSDNPFFYEGKYLKGIGSPHTPNNYVWPIALAVQGLTSRDKEEKNKLIEYLINTDDHTCMMHESIDVNDPINYTRPWFSWANAMYGELMLSYYDIWLPHSPLEKYWRSKNE